MTTILGIDTASGDAFAVGVTSEAGDEVRLHSAALDHSRNLLGVIDELLGGDRSGLDAVAVIRGPGSYAGLRVGIATAYGLGIALRVPVLGAGTLDAAARASGTGQDDQITAVHPAGRGELAAQWFRGTDAINDPQIVTPAELRGIRTAGEGAGALGGMELSAAERCRALLAIARELIAKGDDVAFEPFYLRDPQITAPRRSRMSRAAKP